MFGSNYNDHRASLGYSVRCTAEMNQAFGLTRRLGIIQTAVVTR
jgi:hypothetical protein